MTFSLSSARIPSRTDAHSVKRFLLEILTKETCVKSPFIHARDQENTMYRPKKEMESSGKDCIVAALQAEQREADRRDSSLCRIEKGARAMKKTPAAVYFTENTPFPTSIAVTSTALGMELTSSFLRVAAWGVRRAPLVPWARAALRVLLNFVACSLAKINSEWQPPAIRGLRVEELNDSIELLSPVRSLLPSKRVNLHVKLSFSKVARRDSIHVFVFFVHPTVQLVGRGPCPRVSPGFKEVTLGRRRESPDVCGGVVHVAEECAVRQVFLDGLDDPLLSVSNCGEAGVVHDGDVFEDGFIDDRGRPEFLGVVEATSAITTSLLLASFATTPTCT